MRLLPLATRNLLRNPRRTAISLTALVVGVGSLVGLRGVINGQQQAVLDNVVFGQVGAVQVHRAGYLANVQGSPLTLDLEDSPGLRERLSRVEGVTAVAPRIVFGGMVSLPDEGDAAGRTGYLLLTAYDPELEPRVTPQRLTWLAEGEHLPGGDAPGMMLDAELARGLGTGVMEGSVDEARWPALLAADREGVLNGAPVRLTGTLVEAPLGGRRQGSVPLVTAQRLLRMEGRVTEYALALAHLEEAHAVRDALRAQLGPDYEVHAWDDVLPFVAQLVHHQDFIFGVITLVFLVTVLLGVANVMLMNVLERVREIGTLLAVGLQRRHVVALFLWEGAVLGLVGGVLGAGTGWAVTLWLGRHGLHLPSSGTTADGVIRPHLPVLYVVRSVGLATVGAALAALGPAYRASQLRPVEALAHS
jgi:putative ABC transport system permease protein